MKVLQGNTFLYFGDKNVAKVSGVWKALHITIYVAIAVNAFITSMAAGNMFQTFKYNCILFCTEIVFEKDVLLPEETKSILLKNLNFDESVNDTMLISESDQNSTETIFLNDTMQDSSSIPLLSTKIPNKASGTANKENKTIIFKNQTHIFQYEDESIALIYGKIDVRKSRFGSNFWCDFVLGTALVTFIFSTFCGVILAMCSKGGKGLNNTLNRPQNMVYPILVSSLVLGILNLTASIIVKNGMKDFCANFEMFTEDKRCSSLINQFTIHERQERFYLPYIVLSHSFTLTIILFLCQIIVTALRIIYAVDYQLYALEVEETEELNDLEVEDGQVKERTL